MTISKVQKQIENLYNNNLLTEEVKESLVNTLQKSFHLMEFISYFDKEIDRLYIGIIINALKND